MKPTGTSEAKKEFINGWRQMMITIWQEKINQYKIGDTQALYNSFNSHMQRAGSDVEIIRHEFNLYGVYVERGSGSGMAKRMINQQQKPWMSKKYRSSVFAINKFLADNYGIEGAKMLVRVLS